VEGGGVSQEYVVELPGGGTIHLQSEEEVDRWTTLSESYQRDYKLTKINDLTQLGSLLQQHISMYRAQVGLSGMRQEYDEEGLPTGKWIKDEDRKPADDKRDQEAMNSASKEIREIEKAMGIDAKSRSQTGDETVRDYVTRLKQAGYDYGIHISERVLAFENFTMELRWRLRLEQNGDAEDKAYEDCTPDGICKWARDELAALETVDREFAHDKGKLVLGRL
jgi:hypothetical protein